MASAETFPLSGPAEEEKALQHLEYYLLGLAEAEHEGLDGLVLCTRMAIQPRPARR